MLSHPPSKSSRVNWATNDCKRRSRHSVRIRTIRAQSLRYTFQQLLERQVEKLGLDLVFHIHVPKASGGTVNVLFRQNNFLVLNFDMTTADFFAGYFRGSISRSISTATTSTIIFADRVISVSTILFFVVLGVPHVVITTLRDPIDRMLSNYNFTLRMPHNPWHDDVVTKRHVVPGLCGQMYAAIGPQYSFFDDTGRGTSLPPVPPRRRNAWRIWSQELAFTASRSDLMNSPC